MARKKDITNKRFSRLIAIEPIGKNRYHNIIWNCLCDCGNETKSTTARLLSGNKQSCGCLQKERSPYAQQVKHGMAKTRPYRIWVDIKKRCYKNSNRAYKWYGARGILMSEEWKDDFLNFWNDMKHGYSDNLSIDRIDTTKGYSKENCRWATMKIQNNNRTNNHRYLYNGLNLTIPEWADRIGVDQKLLYSRANKGWKIDRILETRKMSNRFW